MLRSNSHSDKIELLQSRICVKSYWCEILTFINSKLLENGTFVKFYCCEIVLFKRCSCVKSHIWETPTFMNLKLEQNQTCGEVSFAQIPIVRQSNFYPFVLLQNRTSVPFNFCPFVFFCFGGSRVGGAGRAQWTHV